MESPKEITPFQVGNILISSIIGGVLLSFPRLMVERADTAAPLVTLLGILAAMIGLFSLTFLNLRFPKETFFTYSEKIIGRWIAVPLNLMIILFFLLLTSFDAFEFGMVLITTTLAKTPIEVIIISGLILITLSTRHDFATFSYIHQFYTPLFLIPISLIGLLSLKNADVLNLQPIFGMERQGYLEGVWTAASLLQTYFIMSIITKSVRQRERIPVILFWGMLVIAVFFFMTVTITLSVFGPEETKELMWPTLELTKLTSLPGQLLERLDAVFLAVWVMAVFTTSFSTFYLASYGTAELFRLRDHKAFGLFYLPYLFLITNIPKNILSLDEMVGSVRQAGLLLTLLYPLILLVIAVLRQQGERVKIRFFWKEGKGKNAGKVGRERNA